MARELTFNITEDRRRLVEPTNVEGFEITFDRDIISGSKNWVDGRIGEDTARQVFVNVKYGPNNEAYDLTGIIPEFCGLTAKGGPENRNYSIIDNWHSVMIDPQGGRFRFDFPKDAFAVAGSYKQAFFNLKREGSGEVVATLEFDMKVMANFVYSNIIPKDFITPYLEVLDRLISEFKQGNVQKEELISELQKTVQNKLDIIEVTFKSTNDTLESLRATANSLSEKIKQDGLFTQGEADEFKKSVKSDLEDLFTDAKKSMENQTVNDFSSLAISDPQNMYAEEMPPYFKDTFNHATNVPHGDNIVNIAFITDNHHEEDADPWSKKAYSGKSLEHYQWFAQGTLRTKPDVAIANGDNINGNTYRPTMIWTTMHVWAMLSTVYLKTALFMLPGNHDSGVGQTPKLVAEDAMTEHDLKNAYHTVKPLYGEVRNGDSLYFYKDLTDKKVRVIGLNSSDMPWTTDNQGNYVHNRLEEAGFGVAQLKWLVNVALKLPDNSWQVVFFFHHPLSTGTFYNAQALIDIIKAFKNGGSVVINRSDVDDMQIVGLKADFTTQGAGTVIGVFNGHYHADSQDLTTLNGTPIVITDASLSNSIGEQLERRNTPNEDCWETISIDTNARTIHCYRFGRGADREFNY
ncbi:BppU family phage baseplate upper protein [Lactobacillus salivarius]|uniref:BppU family phage baseplate upper protein n=1 Tax=Ligilactobacillus salivarius TaxID=1624 RepID=UPI0015C5AAF3|nr:BppU family phage baseplate upper protein [Ligilactobacillus salivarius]NXZ96788.1 BppU family phage baseplate upper protein [Ligilactobacillus salivarius]NYA58964.1 BppU family phage baseplate upper protein [Ligilactobacillus salivarius]NYA60496.1 BppU family phage baseplate upper protein [Ligilactobacillus salivarius]NYA66043.1 BppU family phage baseplate upper protein [Ligilactobacillus salivarius]NYA67542.1 BppU family phage baseplate upper protein [Ligilactobacillus salivarius]